MQDFTTQHLSLSSPNIMTSCWLDKTFLHCVSTNEFSERACVELPPCGSPSCDGLTSWGRDRPPCAAHRHLPRLQNPFANPLQISDHKENKEIAMKTRKSSSLLNCSSQNKDERLWNSMKILCKPIYERHRKRIPSIMKRNLRDIIGKTSQASY